MLRKTAKAIGGILKLLGGLVRIAPALLTQRRKAIASFRNHLNTQGLAKETVNTLTKEFKSLYSPTNLLAILKDFNLPTSKNK